MFHQIGDRDNAIFQSQWNNFKIHSSTLLVSLSAHQPIRKKERKNDESSEWMINQSQRFFPTDRIAPASEKLKAQNDEKPHSSLKQEAVASVEQQNINHQTIEVSIPFILEIIFHHVCTNQQTCNSVLLHRPQWNFWEKNFSPSDSINIPIPFLLNDKH